MKKVIKIQVDGATPESKLTLEEFDEITTRFLMSQDNEDRGYNYYTRREEASPIIDKLREFLFPYETGREVRYNKFKEMQPEYLKLAAEFNGVDFK
jgi:hypothetical protein